MYRLINTNVALEVELAANNSQKTKWLYALSHGMAGSV